MFLLALQLGEYKVHAGDLFQDLATAEPLENEGLKLKAVLENHDDQFLVDMMSATDTEGKIKRETLNELLELPAFNFKVLVNLHDS